MRLRSITAGLIIASLAVCPLAPAAMVEQLFFGRTAVGLTEQLTVSERPQQAEIRTTDAESPPTGFARSRMSRTVDQFALEIASGSAAPALVPPNPRRLGPTIAPRPLPGRLWDPAPTARGPPAA